MAEAINCCYARISVRSIAQKLYMGIEGVKTLSTQSMAQLVVEYNALFENNPAMHLQNQKNSTIKKLLALFNTHWKLQNRKDDFLNTFSFAEWNKLTQNQRAQHTIKKCKGCPMQHPLLSTAFPSKKHAQQEKKSIPILPDISSSSTLGKTVYTQLNEIAHEYFGETATTVLASVPNSGLIQNPGRTERQRHMRSIVKKAKQTIQNAMNENSFSTVMANRISWSTFNKMRTATLTDRKRRTTNKDMPSPKRKLTYNGSFEEISDQQSLLEEARSWLPEQKVNWSELAKQYGIQKQNGGQIIKEWLKKHNIPTANKQNKEQRKNRRARKKLPGNIPFPMPKPCVIQKQELAKLVESGEILVGEKVVETEYTSFKVDTVTNCVVQSNCKLAAQKIRLIDIRKRLLAKHEGLGVIRNQPDAYYEQLPSMQVSTKLEELNENTEITKEEDLCSHLKKISHQRFLKVWHDHSCIANHEHFLVVVSCIHDPAFYFTPAELGGVDVQSIVEKPELHILACSNATLEDQVLFNKSRLECVKELISDPLPTSTGVPVRDILRFFHGDGPAQQFEAGNNIGGTYPCVCCAVNAESISDLEYAFKCPTRTLTERQQFVISGCAWKKGGVNPFDKLKVAQLRKELNERGLKTDEKKKPELLEMLKSTRQGISNLPPLLQPNPKATLDTLGLDQYEISPCEPLHDLKSHFSNIIEETEHLLSRNELTEFQVIKAAVLGKATLRCSDYRKAMILFYLKLNEIKADQTIVDIFQSAVHMSHLLYTSDYHRTPKAILALHNLSFLHGMLCTEVFSAATSSVFGRYFHSLTTHSPILFRIVSMRSINTEDQERMFGQAKMITKATSCNRPNEIITNILQRVQMESRSHEMTVSDKDESEVRKLHQTIGPRCNTMYSNSFITRHAPQYQAHLERISDYLLPGEGTWWKQSTDGVEFLDGQVENNVSDKGPKLMHFRTTSMRDIEIYLQQKWEDCILSRVKLPANDIQHYIPYESNPDMETMIEKTHSSIQIEDLSIPTLECTTPIEVTVSTSMDNTVRISQPEYSHQQPKPQYYTSLVRSLYEHNILLPSKTLAKFDLARHKLKNLSSSATVNDALQTEYTKLRLLIKNKLQKRIMELTSDTKLQNIAKRLLSHEWMTG